MKIFDLFSKKQKKRRGDLPDVYMYDEIPQELRVQIIHLWNDALGSKSEYNDKSSQVKNTYKHIAEVLCREYGMFTLASFSRDEARDFRYELQAFFLTETDIDRLIDVIEMTFMAIDQKTRTIDYCSSENPDETADEAIKELNERFREHSVGYKFEEGMIMRIDSELIHDKIVKPALRILNAKYFKKPQQDFFDAYRYFHEGNHGKALGYALKAFKNTLTAICSKKKWQYNPKASISELLDICIEQGLIPPFWETQMENLKNLLENGAAICSSKETRDSADDHIVSYVLNMTASAIVFLAESEKKL